MIGDSATAVEFQLPWRIAYAPGNLSFESSATAIAEQPVQ